MFDNRTIRNLEYELKDLSQKYYNLSFELSLIRNYLGVSMKTVPAKTILIEDDKVKK